MKGDTIILKRDTVIRNKLLQIDFNSFIGRKVQDLLNDETIGQYKTHFWSDEPPSILHSLFLTYAPGLYVEVIVNRLKYQPQFSESREFSFELYKKEKISKINLNKRWFEEKIKRP